ncbi:hypothetical protein F0919_02435 [Taibaiella lutea]|uniref:Uncharacterized protein n=1 Tax=Taibaiella lutea TaxID=2608001 RepID=A0A5M6CU72_9BACT|nr:hypothetical protein [Taibaiella lutea]KAA5536545.1 hypothetical protein F0919_02435 [Taibaiella lutea]
MTKNILFKRKWHYVFIIMQLVFVQITYSQNSTKVKYDSYTEIDSSLLMNKAKLLTLSKFGVNDIDTIIKGLLSQKSKIYHTSSKFYDVIEIISNQGFSIDIKTKKSIQTHYCGEDTEDNSRCSYVLIFSHHTYRFYNLIGFSSIEIEALEKELNSYSESIFDIVSVHLAKELSIDLNCLLSKYLKEKKQFKNRKCFKECGRCMELGVIY